MGRRDIQIVQDSGFIGSSISMVAEIAATPDYERMTSLTFSAIKWFDGAKHVNLPEEDFETIVADRAAITITSQAGIPVEQHAPNGEHFTFRCFMAAVQDTERRTRGKTKWFGGVDCHHIFFEGAMPTDDGAAYFVYWGS